MFGEKQLADLTIAIGLMNAYNRIAISFRATPMALSNGHFDGHTINPVTHLRLDMRST